jgi:hypothetical protein
MLVGLECVFEISGPQSRIPMGMATSLDPCSASIRQLQPTRVFTHDAPRQSTRQRSRPTISNRKAPLSARKAPLSERQSLMPLEIKGIFAPLDQQTWSRTKKNVETPRKGRVNVTP